MINFTNSKLSKPDLHENPAQKKNECIGCALCEQEAPEYFTMDKEGMAILIDSVELGVFHHRKGLEYDRPSLARAAEGCPVNIIHVD